MTRPNVRLRVAYFKVVPLDFIQGKEDLFTDYGHVRIDLPERTEEEKAALVEAARDYFDGRDFNPAYGYYHIQHYQYQLPCGEWSSICCVRTRVV